MTPHTPFPNKLIDEVMPTLRDTEWRVLCVIVRSTLGWRMPDRSRKQSDRISHRQLMRRTGRQSEAVSRAIARLVCAGLITVIDAEGDVIGTPRARQRHRGRIFYEVSAAVVGENVSIRAMRF